MANPVNRCFLLQDEPLRQHRPAHERPRWCRAPTLDDLGEYRPGLDAARDHGPCGTPTSKPSIDKRGVRALARESFGLGATCPNCLPHPACPAGSRPASPSGPEVLRAIHEVERRPGPRLSRACHRALPRAGQAGVVDRTRRAATLDAAFDDGPPRGRARPMSRACFDGAAARGRRSPSRPIATVQRLPPGRFNWQPGGAPARGIRPGERSSGSTSTGMTAHRPRRGDLLRRQNGRPDRGHRRQRSRAGWRRPAADPARSGAKFAALPERQRAALDYERGVAYRDPGYQPRARRWPWPPVGVVMAGTSDVPMGRRSPAAHSMFNGQPDTRPSLTSGSPGLWRLLERHRRDPPRCPVLIVAAGMDAALVSVVGGLVRRAGHRAADLCRLRGGRRAAMHGASFRAGELRARCSRW